MTKSDLEQRHPQLEDIFTLAQNIKNKTSNLDVRTSITEKRMCRPGRSRGVLTHVCEEEECGKEKKKNVPLDGNHLLSSCTKDTDQEQDKLNMVQIKKKYIKKVY